MGHLHDWWEALRAGTLPWLHRWLALVGAYAEGEAAVRLKTDMQADDPAFRDRVLREAEALQ